MLSTGKKSRIFTFVASVTRSIGRWFRTAWQHVEAVSERLEHQHVFLLAAGIAFNVLLCVLPLLGLVIVVASLVVPPDDVKAAITGALTGALPPTQQIHLLLERMLIEIERVRSYAVTATVVAAIVLLWTASALLSSLRTALNAIFSIPTPGSFVWYKLRDLLLTLVLVLIVSVMLLLTPVLSLFGSNLAQAIPLLDTLHISGWLSLGAHLVSALVFMYLLYHFVPSQPQPMFIIVRASVVALILWEIARVAFSAYIAHARSLGTIYGTFSLVVIAALWMYYTALIVLVSAEVAEYWWEQRHAKT